MRFPAAIVAIVAFVIGCASAAAAPSPVDFDEAAFWSRVKVDPSLPSLLRARASAAVKRLLGAPSLRARARMIADAGYDVLITTCASAELSSGAALPYARRTGGVAGYAKGEVAASFHAGRIPNFRVCWDESYTQDIPGRGGNMAEVIIAHELFGHAATNAMRLNAIIPAGAMALRSENELNAYMLQAVAMRELGYPYDHPFSGKKPAGLRAYKQQVIFSLPQYARLLTAREAGAPLQAYEQRLPRWTESCRADLAGACAAAADLAARIASLRTESGRAAFARDVVSPRADAFHAGLQKESEALRRKLAVLGRGRETEGMFSYDPRLDEIRFGAPIPADEAR